MADLTYEHLPGVAPLVAGGQPDAPTIEDNLYFASDTADPRPSLEVINGWLDEDNLAAGEVFSRRHVQAGEFTGTGAVGSTANLDYFDTSFNYNILREERNGAYPWDMRRNIPSDAELASKHIAIPGACCTFYIPESAGEHVSVLLSWNIGWFNDGLFQPGLSGDQWVSNVSRLQLFWDDTPQAVQKRVCPPNCHRGPLLTGKHVNNRDHARVYSGHKVVKGVASGWHTAALKVSAPNDGGPYGTTGVVAVSHRVRQTRVRVRSMRYIWFKSIDDVPPPPP